MPFIYGKYPVQEFLKRYPEQAVKLWLSSSCSDRFNETCMLPLERLSRAQLTSKFRLRDFENPQGVLLEIKTSLNELLCEPLEELLERCTHLGKSLLWLPSIQDSHNLGAVVRSSVALNQVGGIIIPANNAVQLTASVAKISAGSLFAMRFAHSHNWGQTVNILKSSGLKIVTLEKKQKSQPLDKTNLRDPQSLALVIGSEERGIPSIISKQSDSSVMIPQNDEVDSLNLSVACAILLYEMNRQRSS